MNTDTICVSCMKDDSGSPFCPSCGAPFNPAIGNHLDLRPRTVLREQYLIGRVLGHGGFGITYLAWDINLATRLAIKEYLPSGIAGRSGLTSLTSIVPHSDATKGDFDWGLTRFIEEARTLREFGNHENIVSVSTVFRENGTAYLVMEYLEGTNLEEFLQSRGGTVDFQTALQLMRPVMDALTAVHAAGILHRDVSPNNIHVSPVGKVKLIDFGAARCELSQKSRKLSVVFTSGYAPEEQYREGGVQGPWSDVYAVAATFYRAITGKPPLGSIDRLAEDKLVPPSREGVKIPPFAEAALMKALSVRAGDRFQTMEDFKRSITGGAGPSALPPVQGSKVVAAVPLPPPPQQTGTATPVQRKWLPAAIVLACILLLVGIRLWRTRQRDLTPIPPPKISFQTDEQRQQALTGGDGRIEDQPPAPGPAPAVAEVVPLPATPVPVRPSPMATIPPSEPAPVPVTPPRQVAAATPPETPPAPRVTKASYESILAQAKTQSGLGRSAEAEELLKGAIQAEPNRPEAYNRLAEIELYDLGLSDLAFQHYRNALDKGGVATFRAKHDSGTGLLSVSPGKASFKAITGNHDQDFASSEVIEAKKNKNPLSHAFHIRLGSRNYNFSPTSKSGGPEADFIVKAINR
jgi:serine/threonine protein kinase